MSPTRLETTWKNIDEIERDVAERKTILIRNTNTAKTYQLRQNTGKTITQYETNFDPLIMFFYADAWPYKEDVHTLAINYDIHLYNIAENFLPFLTAEIIVRNGTGTLPVESGDELPVLPLYDNLEYVNGVSSVSEEVFIRRSPFWRSQKIYERISDTHYVIHRSLYIEKFSYPDYPWATGGVFQEEDVLLKTLHGKLILKILNPSFLL